MLAHQGEDQIHIVPLVERAFPDVSASVASRSGHGPVDRQFRVAAFDQAGTFQPSMSLPIDERYVPAFIHIGMSGIRPEPQRTRRLKPSTGSGPRSRSATSPERIASASSASTGSIAASYLSSTSSVCATEQ